MRRSMRTVFVADASSFLCFGANERGGSAGLLRLTDCCRKGYVVPATMPMRVRLS